MTRTTKISTVQRQTAAPDWKRRFFICPDSWCETQKETHHDTNTDCIDPHPCGQPKPPPLEQQRHLLVPLHPPSPGLHQAPCAPELGNPMHPACPQAPGSTPPTRGERRRSMKKVKGIRDSRQPCLEKPANEAGCPRIKTWRGDRRVAPRLRRDRAVWFSANSRGRDRSFPLNAKTALSIETRSVFRYRVSGPTQNLAPRRQVVDTAVLCRAGSARE